MSLTPGTLLGPYAILAEIGSGGMGVVYQALDTRLNREVAVKLIQQGPDSARMVQRLEQEAKVLASLSHPGIVQVYDVGQHGDSPFVVMELLLGESLRQRMDRGPLPTAKVIDLFAQIAVGLSAAHDKGILHRDIKPENVFITPDEQVKILDFGLAKPMPMPDDTGRTPTRRHPLQMPRPTEEGLLVGTMGYCSPEQIRGTGLDPRSDIFALGAMLYEVVFLRMPFQGDTAADTLTAILREEPAFPLASSPGYPHALERLIRTCLKKEPGARFQSAWDLSLALQALQTSPALTTAAPDPAPRKQRPRRPWRWLLGGLASAAVLALAVLAGRAAPWGARQAEWLALTARPGLTATARFTLDGESIVYSSTLGSAPPTLQTLRIGQIIPKSLGVVGQAMAVGGDGSLLFVGSPNRVHPGAAATGTLSEIRVEGAESRPLVEQAESADWSRDGHTLAVVRVEVGPSGRIYHLECPPGQVLHRTSGWLYCPRISPDGTRLAVLESQGPDSWVAKARVLDLKGRTLFLSQVLDIQSQAWSPDGKELLFTRTPGVIAALDLRGRVRPVLQGPHLLHLYDVAMDGRMLVASYQDHTEIVVTHDGQPVRNSALNAWAARISADGRTLLFTGPGPKRTDMTYLQPTDGDSLHPIAPGRLLATNDDASAILIKRKEQLYRVPTGPGTEAQVPLGSLGTVWRASFLADGRRIAVVAAAPGEDFKVHVLDPDRPPATLAGSEGIRHLVPLGPETVVGSTPTGLLRRFALDGSPPAPVKGAQAGDIPLRMNAAGDALFVQEAYGQPGLLRIWTLGLRDGQRKLWRSLEFAVQPGLRNAQAMAITPDGRTLAYFTWAQPDDLYTVGGLIPVSR